MCILAVQQNGNALRYVENQTEGICKIAVKQDGNALRFVEKYYKSVTNVLWEKECKRLQSLPELI